jgi:subtilisin-like proprotein convertase family protein
MAGRGAKRGFGTGIGLGGLVALAATLALPAAVSADTVTLTNNDGIQFTAADPSVHPGDPFPSTITGPAGTVNDVNVGVGQTHASPDDLDVALVSPNGTAVHLQSDACQLDANVFRPLTFDDAATLNLSDAGNCLSANNPYKPSNYGEAIDIYTAPGPQAGTLNALSFFNGGPSGGAWRLFTMDDTTGNGGSITGWSITLDFTPPAAPAPPAPPPTKKKCKKKKKKKKKCKKKKRR